MTTGSAGPGRNATADRAIDILLLFDEQQPVLTAEEIADRLGMSRSTTYRYLQTLRSAGLIEEGEASGRFRLGPTLIRLARIARQGWGLSEVALPVMRALVDQVGETAILTRRSGAHVITIERVESRHPVRLSYDRGHILPLHAGASAKVLLAFLEPDEIEAVLKEGPFPRYTDHTITEPDTLRTQLAAIRERGYAMSEGEVDAGVRGVAAPIWGLDGRVLAGLSVAGPQFRIDDAMLPRVVDAVRGAADEITRRWRELEQ